MRLGEECPYITPCGWCSRQEKPCEKKPIYRVDLSALDVTPAVEALKNLTGRFKAEAEQMKGEAVPLEEDEAWQQTLSGRKS